MEGKHKAKKSGLATAGMVLGIIGAVLAFIPIINNVAFVLGILAVIFGAIALAKKASTTKAIAALVLGIVSIAITIMMQQAFSNAIDKAMEPTKTNAGTSESSDKETVFDGAAAFTKIKTGMTKAEVNKAVELEPSSCTESEDETLGKTEYCSYGNMFTDKVTIDVIFSQGKLSSKTKSTH